MLSAVRTVGSPQTLEAEAALLPMPQVASVTVVLTVTILPTILPEGT